jgi:hypothetical protein
MIRTPDLSLASGPSSLSVSVVENINVMSMLSLSEAYVRANGVEREPFQALRIVVASARNWAHYIGLIVVGSTLLVLYAVLYRFALVPRALALWLITKGFRGHAFPRNERRDA